jgi:hypothetical protein
MDLQGAELEPKPLELYCDCTQYNRVSTWSAIVMSGPFQGPKQPHTPRTPRRGTADRASPQSYGSTAAMGSQALSPRVTSPRYSFGRPQGGESPRSPCAGHDTGPGPGAYQSTSSMGAQVLT